MMFVAGSDRIVYCTYKGIAKYSDDLEFSDGHLHRKS